MDGANADATNANADETDVNATNAGDADNVNADETGATTDNANAQLNQTDRAKLIEKYPAFFVDTLNLLVDRHREILTRLGLLTLPTSVFFYRDKYRKFSPKLVKKHPYQNVFAYFKFLRDELSQAYAEDRMLRSKPNAPAQSKRVFDLFPVSKDRILFTSIDVKILEWLLTKKIPGNSDLRFTDDLDWWRLAFRFAPEMLRIIPQGISIRTDGIYAAITVPKKVKKVSDDANPAVHESALNAVENTEDDLEVDDDLDPSSSNANEEVDDDLDPSSSTANQGRKRKSNGKLPVNASKNQKLANNSRSKKAVATSKKKSAAAKKPSNWIQIKDGCLPKTGLIHIKQIKTKELIRALKKRVEMGKGRVIGTDPGQIDAITVARSDDPEDSFRMSSAFW